jgi:hypothetical protein
MLRTGSKSNDGVRITPSNNSSVEPPLANHPDQN